MKYIPFILLTCFLWTCKNDVKNTSQESVEYTKDDFVLPDWAKNATIYEANIRHMSEEGNFDGLTQQLPRLKEMGMDIIWLMPIHPISMIKRKAKGDLNVEDIEDPEERELYLGSPYSVADYKKVNPDYGTMDDFKALLKTAHDLGQKVIIDWVPNHTGWDNPWITEHPEWYTQDSLGNIIDPIDYNTGKSWGWTDVADLNYDNKEMRAAMIETMKFWLTDVGIDGFRVDVAHGIPQDFWDEATPELMKAKKDVFLLAESEVPSNRNNKTFHMDYGWAFHHLINDIAKGHKKASAIDSFMIKDNETFREGFHMYFTSNHDENTWAGTVFDRMGDADKVMFVLCSTFDGMPLVYSGMEEPMTKRLAFFVKDNIGFKNYAYADFFKTLFDLKHKNQALWNGEYGGKYKSILKHDHVFAYEREKNGDKVVCFLNLSDKPQTIKVPYDIQMEDIFAEEKVSWSEGQALTIAPWQYYVLSNK
ncbi:MAG: alpha-amylase [Saprospiraceae bacterium]|nr:alpha-amylase [Saprospiraceae bacterium]NNL91620.1 alpha-amylase [Saprospiraceae bacterium]